MVMIMEMHYYINLPSNKDLEQHIVSLAKPRVLDAKEHLIKCGDIVSRIHYLASGQLTHYAMSEDGIEKVGYFNNPGSFVTEYLFSVRGGQFIARNYVYANVKSLVYAIDQECYDKLSVNRAFTDALQNCLYQKFNILRNEVDNISFYSASNRLIELLCCSVDYKAPVKDSQWYPLRVHYTQKEFAAIIGIHRASVARLITELCNEKKIRIVNRKMEINRALLKSKL